MKKRTVLDVGNCGPDHAAIRRMLTENFDVEVHQAHGPNDALDQIRTTAFDLVLINRKLDQDYSDGLEIVKKIKSYEQLASTPVMLITNYDEQQKLAMSEGAIRGFGKLELHSPETHQKLAPFLA